jgi:hypothetical protein
MAASPDWKVYRDNEYVAAFKYAEDAAAFVAITGGHVRNGHRVRDTVWREGAEAFSAGRSYDAAAAVMAERVEAAADAYRRSVGRAS